MSKILITICARGGSKGVKNKNIRLINGIPLINFTIHIAKNLLKNKDALISISTDSETIKMLLKMKDYLQIIKDQKNFQEIIQEKLRLSMIYY